MCMAQKNVPLTHQAEKPFSLWLLVSSMDLQKACMAKVRKNSWRNEKKIEGCQEKCFQKRAGGASVEGSRRAITLVLGSRGLSGTGAWGNIQHGNSMCRQPLDMFGGRLVGYCTYCSRMYLMSNSAPCITALKSTRQSGFVSSWHQIYSHTNSTIIAGNQGSCSMNPARVCQQFSLWAIGCWNALQASEEAQINIVLFSSCFSHVLPCSTLSEGSGSSISSKRTCSVSERISGVSQLSQTISGRDAGELEWQGLDLGPA